MIEERDTLAAGEPVSVYSRLIIPIVRILRFQEGCSFAASANPVAFLVIDDKEVFFVPIDAGMDQTRLTAFLADTFGIISRIEND